MITPGLLTRFKRENPELAPYLQKHKLNLRPLDLGFFESWTYWIISQQLNGKVADLLINRFRRLCGKVTPEQVVQVSDSKLRAAGISMSKAEYLKNIARFHLEGNHIEEFEEFSSEEIRKLYSQVRGIGPWTVNMFLIFNLNRLDVLAVNDLVVRKGIKEMYSLPETPTVMEARQIGEKWGNLATIGTLLAWEVIGD